MIHLIGFVCFFSHVNCTAPVAIGPEFKTMDACYELKEKIDKEATPALWIDVKLLCMKDEDVL